VVASCDFEPNNWLNLLPIDELVDELPDEPPNMLPPPQPDSAVLAATASAAIAARFNRLPPAIIASSWPKRSERNWGPYSRAKTANQRHKARFGTLVNRGNPRPAGHTDNGPARPR